MTPSLRTNALISKAVRELVSPCGSPWIKESFEASYLHAESEQTLIIPIHTKLDPKEERLMLFVDFDFTCTSVASLKVLANIEKFAQKPDQQLQGVDRDTLPQITSLDLRKTWELISEQYSSENREFIKKIMHGKKAVSFDYKGLYSAFVKLSSPEEQAFSRIFGSGVLNGISLEDIKQAGKCMICHNGCMDFFEKVNNLDVSVNVMSCWSGDLTRSALSGGLDMLRVDGNEFSYEDGIFTGEVTRQAHQSVTAKLKYFKDMVQEYASKHGVGARTV
ncbi:bifunctional TH2 protein, mitochondrial-like isoform X2 [Papaver somniferum]|uniref:bifunctional TH2 protein, mitochondrial-like isoform X2 n=1 Tax=Papaver somniferum TaxID=3469 RepID=UPI000E7053FE|nr:bifunctional TH2 protein, mitochondrial-like isoform X2 [Papaver somniferum]